MKQEEVDIICEGLRSYSGWVRKLNVLIVNGGMFKQKVDELKLKYYGSMSDSATWYGKPKNGLSREDYNEEYRIIRNKYLPWSRDNNINQYLQALNAYSPSVNIVFDKIAEGFVYENPTASLFD